jgi:asparagine synthase (glutamine-hydrolysing)
MSVDFCAVLSGAPRRDLTADLRRVGLAAAHVSRHVAASAPAGRAHDGRAWFGGECWVGQGLRPRLWAALDDACGAQLPRGSDADLLASWASIEGPQRACARLACGMFSGVLALSDPRDGADCAWLVRDPVGARTLYAARDGDQLWVASRLRTLRRGPAVSGRLSMEALRDYLVYAFIPGQQTLWADARELKPGTIEAWPSGAVTPFWEPSASQPLDGSGSAHGVRLDATLEDQAIALRALLEDLVAERLPSPSDPVSVLLSGGLDSSLITALAARLHGPARVHTFSVHFGTEYRNELPFSSMVARHCGTQHHVLELPVSLIQRNLPDTLLALDDPIGDPLTVPNLLLARQAASVAPTLLNGEGGDPCFGGPKNIPMILHTLYGGDDDDDHADGADSSSDPFFHERAYLRAYQKCYDDLPQLLTAATHDALRAFPPQEAALTPFFQHPRLPSLLDRLMWINVCFKGSDQILTKVNNLTSAAAVLGLSPLFDPRVVDASFHLPPEHKLLGSQEKVALKAAAAPWLPHAIIHRPKSGMLVPVQYWFRKDLKKYAAKLLLDRRAATRPYLNPDLVRRWIDYKDNLWPRHGVKLWLLLTLELWLRLHGDQDI